MREEAIAPSAAGGRTKGACVNLRALFAIAALLACAPVQPAQEGAVDGDAQPSKLVDPVDGWLDVSGFLDTAYGFIPVVAPITEPAIGYGAVGALVFIDRDTASTGQRYTRPNIALAGGLSTQNGTRGLFAGHLGTWMDGRLRTLIAAADADVNLDFFGLGGERAPGEGGVGYSISARGGAAGASYRIGDIPLWVGLRYGLAATDVALPPATAGLPSVAPSDSGLRLAALTPSLTIDGRDNFFTPTKGWYADLSIGLFHDAFGSDRNFEKAVLTAMVHQPLNRTMFLSMRGTARSSSDGTPFYLRPFVVLRGVQALRYQGEQAADIEAELRWQVHSRFSVVGFGGAGVARGDRGQQEREKSVTAGGLGFRYLVARTYGLHMGLDVAIGPDKPVIYVVFGNAWLRP